MKYGLLSSWTAMLVGTGLAIAQNPAPLQPLPVAPSARPLSQAPTSKPILKGTILHHFRAPTVDGFPDGAPPVPDYPARLPATYLPATIQQTSAVGMAPQAGVVPAMYGPEADDIQPTSTFSAAASAGAMMTAPGQGPVVMEGAMPYENYGAAPETAVFNALAWNQYTVWVNGEYLLWKVSNPRVPLVNLNRSGVVPISTNQTIIDQAGTVSSNLVFDNELNVAVGIVSGVPGGQTLEYEFQPGFRVQTGLWFDPWKNLGVELGFMYLGQKDVTYTSQTSQFTGTSFDTGLTNEITLIPVAGSLFTENVSTVLPVVFQALPGSAVVLSGKAQTRLYGLEANARTGDYGVPGLFFDFLAGFRFINFDEALIQSERVILNTQFASNQPPTTVNGNTEFPAELIPFNLDILLNDSIKTRNQFYGGQVGTQVEGWVGRFFFGGIVKVAAGHMHQSVDLLGFNNINSDGGLFVQAIDNGRHTRARAAWLTEFTIKGGAQIGPARAWIGYNWLYISNVARAGQQIVFSETQTSLRVGETSVPVNVLSPGFRFTDNNLWINGLNFGAELRF
ncbi:MAG: BBP7 family outer membrane beta-barrel protein [Gemmataceae bacterium]